MRKSPPKTNVEQGAALVTALILLLVLTVLGVSTMSTASMEMRMAANNQFLENAFQLAETGLNGDLARLNSGAITAPAPQGINPATGIGDCSPQTTGTIAEFPNSSFTNDICFIGIDVMSNGTSIGVMVDFMFQNDSQAIAQSQASSLQSLGMKIQGPAAAGQQGQQ